MDPTFRVHPLASKPSTPKSFEKAEKNRSHLSFHFISIQRHFDRFDHASPAALSVQVGIMVARFFSTQNTKTGQKIYPMATKYTEWP
jgi:hypothetical protein